MNYIKSRIGIFLGTVSLILGFIGIFLPLLPTTPFLLLAAYLYSQSSPKLFRWLMRHKSLGPYIRTFRDSKAIPLRAKIISLLMLWGTIFCSITLIKLFWVQILLFCIASGVTIHILSFKTLRK